MAKELAEHVHCTMTARKSCLVCLQLAETKSTWYGRAAAVTIVLQVSDDVTTFLKKLTLIACHSDHQSDGDTRPIPNNPCRILGKGTPSIDKWTLFPGINTNCLTPTGPSLNLKNTFSTIYFAFTSLFSATHYIYSQPLLCQNWLYHLSLFARYHIGATSIFLSYPVASKHIFLWKY